MVVIDGEESEGETHNAAMMEDTITINDAIVGGHLEQDRDRELPVTTVLYPTGIFGGRTTGVAGVGTGSNGGRSPGAGK